MNTQALARPWWLLPPGRLHPLWWIGIAGLLLALDYVTGADTLLPAAYVIPVTLAAWYSGRRPALVLAVGMPLAHVAFVVARGSLPQPLAVVLATTSIRGGVVVMMALWFARLSEHERELHRHVRTLEGLLHICAFCKKIRNKDGDWDQLERVISERSEAQFSHGYCPECIKANYPAYADVEDDDASTQTVN